jgi:hypothetical protein
MPPQRLEFLIACMTVGLRQTLSAQTSRNQSEEDSTKRYIPRLTYANVVATVALFIALGGVGYAATQLPKNSVEARQRRRDRGPGLLGTRRLERPHIAAYPRVHPTPPPSRDHRYFAC